MPDAIVIGKRAIGAGQPCFIIAEAGVNHNGDPALAVRLVQAAVAAGVDAVKFQTFNAKRLATFAAPKARYQVETTGESESQLDMLSRLELSPTCIVGCWPNASGPGIQFLSSPFDEPSADLLESLGVAAFKVPSGEITNFPYLSHLARKGRPLIVSTGMATLDEVESAVRAIAAAGNPPIVLLHCVSNYPADPASVNLRAMATMSRAFQVAVGYSDHTIGNEVALAAVVLGACVIEKHFTLYRSLPGPDHRALLEPLELASLVRGIRTVEAARGDGCKRPAASEAETAAVARKSLAAATDLIAGTILTESMVAVKRPGTGLPPGMLPQVVGRRLCRTVPKDALLTMEDLT